MKRHGITILTVLFALVVLISANCILTTQAATVEDLTYEIRNDRVTITDCNENASGELVIPDTIEGYPVTCIASWGAFMDCSSLTSVTIPDSVTSIGSSAFAGCTSLTSMVIPDSVTVVGTSVFNNCTSLTSVTIGKGVTKIGDWMFSGCSSLTMVTIPDSVYKIEESAFAFCTSLEQVICGNGLAYVGASAFEHCSNLSQITFGTGISNIGSSAFDGCTALTAVHIPSITQWCSICFGNTPTSNPLYYAQKLYADGELVTSVEFPRGCKSIGQYTFCNYTALTQVSIPDTVSSIGDSAFKGCTGLIHISLPVGLTSIGENAFYGCSITELILPEGLSVIGNYAFDRCKGLKTVVVPKSLQTVGFGAFEYCSELTAVHISDLSAWMNIDFGSSGSNPLCYGKNLYIDGNLVTKITLPQNVTALKDYAFFGCKSLEGIVIGDTVQSVGIQAFSGCTSLTQVTMGNTVMSIGRSAFSGCTSLTQVTMEKTVTSIGDSAFQNCSALIQVDIPASVGKIGSYAFSGCGALMGIWVDSTNACYSSDSYGVLFDKEQKILIKAPGGLSGDYTVPETVVKISDSAFSGCSITNLTLPDRVIEFGNDALPSSSKMNFNVKDGAKYLGNSDNPYVCLVDVENTNITQFTITDRTKMIAKRAFYGCDQLTTIAIPNNVAFIDQEAFRDCDALTSVVFGDGNVTIGEYAFCYCEALMSMVFGDGNVTIGEYAFRYCESLISVAFGNGNVKIGEYGFGDCDALTSVTFGNGDKNIEENAFSGSSALAELNFGTGSVSIARGVFSYNKHLTELRISGESITIDESAFSNCTSLTSVELCGNVTIGSRCFADCSKLADVVFDGGTLFIQYSAFNNCRGLQNISLPDTILGIESYAFEGCYNLSYYTDDDGSSYLGNADNHNLVLVKASKQLQTFTIPEKTKVILSGAFYDCRDLQNVYVKNIEQWFDLYFANFSASPLYWADNLNFLEPFSGEFIIPEGTTRINPRAFYNVNNLMKVVIPSSVLSIGEGAFSGCKNLREVVLSEGLIEIGGDAFYNCSSLTDLYIPDSVERLGYRVVGGCNIHCSSLEKWLSLPRVSNPFAYNFALFIDSVPVTRVVYPQEHSKVINHAFDGCTNLEQIIIPEGITSIGYMAFRDCKNLKTVQIGEGLTEIDGYAFSGCSALKVLPVPSTLKTVEIDAFRECDALSELYITDLAAWMKIIYKEDPSGQVSDQRIPHKKLYLNGELVTSLSTPMNVSHIQESTFEGQTDLKTVVMSNAVNVMGPWAFFECTALEEVTLSENLKVINKQTFEGCSRLDRVFLPEGVTLIQYKAFANCTALNTVVIPQSVMHIDPTAFENSNVAQVYFTGTDQQWKELCIDIPDATVHTGYIPIEITSQPADQTASKGSTAKFTVIVAGDDLCYQWQYRTSSTDSWKAASATGSKTATLSVPATESRNGHQYRCIISDTAGQTVVSQSATLNVVTLNVSTQPANANLPTGKTAKFIVKATGEGLTYQWQYRTSAKGSWRNINATGYKTATLSVPVTAARNGYQYRCVITDKYGNVINSNAANLTVVTLKVTAQPANANLPTGKTAKFTVKASGEVLKYQWQYRTSSKGSWKNETASGSKTATVSIPVTAARNGYQYRCVITDKYGNVVNSNAATLKVVTLKVTKQPANKYLPAGKTAKFTVKVSGTGLKYQWQYRTSSKGSWKNASGAGSKTATLSVKAKASMKGYQYRCKITDKYGNVIYSNAATLKIVTLKITTQPASVTLAKGKTATFKVIAKGTGLKYQWQFRKNAKGAWKKATNTGNKTATLKVPVTAARNGYQYRCVITDKYGNVINSNAATLKVKK